MRTITIFTLAIAALLALDAAQQKDTKAEAQLQAAINKETVDGDLKAAIEQYRRIAQSSNRQVAGKALVRMGQCYEKLGDKEARKAYERAIRDFADLPEVVNTAKSRLAALEGGSESGVSARLLYSYPGSGPEQRFSQDGRLYAFTDSGGGIGIREVSTGQTRLIAKSGNPEFLALSRDGKQIAFCDWNRDSKTNRWISELRVIGTDGANSRTIPFGSPDMMAGPNDWSPDGRHLLINRWPGASSPMDMVLIDAATGALKVAGKTPSRRGGKFSPDGKFIVFEAGPGSGPGGPTEDRDIYVMAADGSQETPILIGPSREENPVWSPDGSHILFVSNRSGSSGLWSIRFQNGRTVGEPQLVQQGFPGSVIDITGNGVLYYRVQASVGDVYTAGLDPATGKLTGQPQRQTQVAINRGPVWSPDGTTLAYFAKCSAVHSFRDLPDLVLRAPGGAEKVLKERFRGSCSVNPLAWFPDGRSLLVRQLREVQALDITSGATRTVFRGFDGRGYAALAPDGKFLYHSGWDMAGGIYRRDEAGNATLIAPTSSFTKSVRGASLSVSPDGNRIAILDSGRVRVFPSRRGPIRDLFQPRAGIVTQGPPLTRTVWSPDGKYVYFNVPVDEKQPTMRLWRAPAEGGEPEMILDMPGVAILAPSIHPGGRQIAFSTDHTRSETWELRNVLSQLKLQR
ncbi:MAG: PD40 domain-containing protein [Acidobacteria bacterium]|nr:PD40 domain-containing protein [Acidobacteriota bacterium]